MIKNNMTPGKESAEALVMQTDTRLLFQGYKQRRTGISTRVRCTHTHR